MSDLQLSLIVIGAAAVAGVVAYNKWQERKARRAAEQAFRSEHADVLLQRRAEAAEPGERIEPVIAALEDDPIDEAPPSAAASEPLLEPLAAEQPVVIPEPPLPVVDAAIDCIVRLEAAEPIGAPLLWQAQQELWRQLSKPVLWLGFNEHSGQWDTLSRHSAGTYRRLVAALQLADRRGPLSDADLSLFTSGMQQLADRYLAVAEPAERNDVLTRAAALDQFCAGVDVQIGVNVVSNDRGGFPGTKLRGVAEAAGFSLQEDGAFHIIDEVGRSLFTLSNLEPALFAHEEMKNLVTHGVTLSLDVPRAPNGGSVFNRMILVAQQLAAGLHGVVVDDNRAPLSEHSLQVIRGKIVEFQQAMAQRGIPAGGELALRLFV